MVNIYDNANALATTVREIPEFIALKEAFEKVKADDAAYKIFFDLQTLQQTIQEKHYKGEELEEDEMTKMQSLATLVMSNDLLKDFTEKEYALNNVINDVTRIITTPIMEIYK
ncbi:MAG: YlbF family regulator [Lactobacillales bacterium]|nr:YlbF family regulator [Lactobacillales bacterium]